MYPDRSVMGPNDLLLVVDVQYDFCPGGSLAVNEGDQIIPIINSLMDKFSRVMGTQDWHPGSHNSFASNYPGKKPMDMISLNGIDQVLWPDHCVQGTKGADFHEELNTNIFQAIIRKGFNKEVDSYSAFRENDKVSETGLNGMLKGLDIKKIYLCGLATDYCVFYSAMDAISNGYETLVILDATRGVNVPQSSVKRSIESMKNRGIKIINSTDI